MDDTGAASHVEIELTPNDDAARWSRRARSAEVTDPSGAPPWTGGSGSGLPSAADPSSGVLVAAGPEAPVGGPMSADRGRLVVTAVATGAIALFVGWALGRSGGDVSSSTASSVPVSSTAAPTVPPDETLPPAVVPGPTRPPRTTTTTNAPEWIEEQLVLAPALAGTTDRLVALTVTNELLDIDLATGALRRLVLRGASGNNGVEAGRDWVLFWRDDGSALVQRGDSTSLQRAQFAPVYETSRQPGTDRFWRMAFDPRSGTPTQAVEVGLDGEPTGAVIDTHGFYASGADPRGGVIVTDPAGGAFQLTPDGSRRLLDQGRMLALSSDRILSYACRETLADCAFEVTDRATGERRRLDLAADLDPQRLDVGYGYGGGFATAMSVGGRYVALVEWGNANPVIVVVDLDSGQTWDLDGGSPRYGVVSRWSPSSDTLYFLAGDTIRVFDPRDGSTSDVGDISNVTMFAVRPAN